MAARNKRLVAVPEPPAVERAPDLRDSVRAALAKMDWLGPSDDAMRALAIRIAEEIEKAVDRTDELADLRRELAGDESVYKRLQKLEAMCDLTKTVGWLGPQLQGVLRDLGGTPAARKALRPDAPIGGRLAELRAAAAGQYDS